MDITVPTEVLIVGSLLLGFVAYSLVGAVVGAVAYKKMGDDIEATIPCAMFWPVTVTVAFLFFLIWYVLLLPSRSLFSYLTKDK